MLAAYSGKIPSVKELRYSGASYDVQDKGGSTALHWAMDSGNTELIGWMLDDGADINVVDVNEWTPLLRTGSNVCYVSEHCFWGETTDNVIDLFVTFYVK